MKTDVNTKQSPPDIMRRPVSGVCLEACEPGEDVFAYMLRTRGAFDTDYYKRILGAANDFKEGDAAIGVAAADERSRTCARTLLACTHIGELAAHPLLEDELGTWLREGLDRDAAEACANMTLDELKHAVLFDDDSAVRRIMSGLHSEVIGSVVKLMTNNELISVGARLFNPLPGSHIGERGYLGARIQPNSPTDNVNDIRWQVFDGWSYAVGDVLLGTNPVSSDLASILAVERVLADLLKTFGIDTILPHCVLSHIDLQATIEATVPGSTALWFQSIAGSDAANATFDISVAKMRNHASHRTGKYGFYLETGQGADCTNGHSQGIDMVLHESRKYGFARALSRDVAQAQRDGGRTAAPWVHVNDVAGFIGPEVFRTREQLVRCCLEDIVMGKLHGLTIGLDVCSTLHMSVSLSDLDWCLDQIMPACPAYLMALPTKIDPMLGYLTTGFQDHVRLRERFSLRVNDAMAHFFRELGIIDHDGAPTRHFGDPLWVHLCYRRKKGDRRTDEEILNEGRLELATVRNHGVFIAVGHGTKHWELQPELQESIDRIYSDAKACLRAELTPDFIGSIPNVIALTTLSADRSDFILHPRTGEQLTEASLLELRRLKQEYCKQYDVQIVVSDGLNALAISDEGHLQPCLDALHQHLREEGFHVAPAHLVLSSGRVRAGYMIGETLFSDHPGQGTILHIIGERPGSGHHTFSIYMTTAAGSDWAHAGRVDHNITRVISGVATTTTLPAEAAYRAAAILSNVEETQTLR